MEAADREQLKKLGEKYGFGKVGHILLTELASESALQRENYNPEEPSCSFCGKTSEEVDGKMVAGLRALVCVNCLSVCNEIMAQLCSYEEKQQQP